MMNAVEPTADETGSGLLDRVLDVAGPVLAADPPGLPPIAEREAGAGANAEATALLHARAVRAVASIDALLSRQLDAILHHPALQKLEALWRGTWWLLEGVGDDPKVRLRIFDARWGEVVRDLERAPTFDQTVLFNRIYSEEFGTPGGQPFGIVVIDHEVWHKIGRDRPDDVAALSALAEVAAASFCPIVFGADPRLAGMDGFDEIDLRQDLAGAFAGPEYKSWNRLRDQQDARFLSAVAPRLLARERYRGRERRRIGFVYDERIGAHSDSLWLSGSFALAHVALRAMRVHSWPAAIRGATTAGEGGVVDGPARRFLEGDRRGIVARFATENAVSEEQEMAFNAAGVTCLRQLHLTGSAAFLNLPSLHKPPQYEAEAAQMNAKMSAMLNYIFCVCRFAHYVKVMARDWVGKYTDAQQCQRLLQNWLSGYVTGNDDASEEMRVKYPLRQAQVLVNEIVGKPGSYTCEIAIRPHYQLDQIASEFRLTTELGRELGR